MTSMDTISIHNSLYQLASNTWHSIEKMAIRRPNDKSLAIAAFAGTWIKLVVAPLAECLDRIHLLEKAYVDLACLEEGSSKAYRTLCAQADKIFFCFLRILISPFAATYFAVKSCIGMLQSPIKTAKIAAAEADLTVFLDSIHSKRTAVEHALARAAFQKFQSRVEECASGADAAELHFLDHTYVKDQILHKMQHRKEIWGNLVRDSIQRVLYHKTADQMLEKVIDLADELETIEGWKDTVKVSLKVGDAERSDMDEMEDVLFVPPPVLVEHT